HRLTAILAAGLEQKGIVRVNQHFFDTMTLEVGGAQSAIIDSAEAAQINLRILGRGRLGVSLDETSDERTVEQLLAVFLGADHGLDVSALDSGELAAGIPEALQRESGYLEHPVFNSHHSETEMLRYLKQLENKDLALNQAM
ncbi:glycine dehydrogenase (aminomethyl-transferring), partial [Leclercia adecarboxylata]|nr:glycine dehydrogenase (aminomethyl-transferring) [Leclercia adecarboxylata]